MYIGVVVDTVLRHDYDNSSEHCSLLDVKLAIHSLLLLIFVIETQYLHISPLHPIPEHIIPFELFHMPVHSSCYQT